ncbi:unnamed protein product [Ixodes hexagonus]
MKRMTCLLPTKERLKAMLRFIEKYVPRPTLVRSRLNRPGELEASVVQWRRYGAFLAAAIAGWEDSECHLVHELLQLLTGAHRFTSRLLSARPDQFRRDELGLRTFVRALFLREASPEEAVAWLSRILLPWPLVFRAKLLYVLYGPCCQHAIFWDGPLFPQTAQNSELLQKALSELGSALRSLHEHGLGWTQDDTVTVLEELIVLPREWLPQNAALVLSACGLDISVLVLASKLVNGRDADVATTLFNMILVEKRCATSAPLVLEVVCELRKLFAGHRHLALMADMSDSLLRSALTYHALGESR